MTPDGRSPPCCRPDESSWTAADLNGDGKVDIAVAHTGGRG